MSFHGGGVPVNTGPFNALVIGASFGGPRAIQQVLAELPSDFPLPVAIVQHTGPGMTEYWAQSLSEKSRIPVVEATSMARFEPGIVYIAPVGTQMRLSQGAHTVVIRLSLGAEGDLHVPSIDVLFSSAATQFGSGTLAVLLTGLGKDGAKGMLAVRRAGGYTIAESAATALSHSMPGAAVAAGAVLEELPLPKMAQRVIELAGRR